VVDARPRHEQARGSGLSRLRNVAPKSITRMPPQHLAHISTFLSLNGDAASGNQCPMVSRGSPLGG
jgi:hypothetical protein